MIWECNFWNKIKVNKIKAKINYNNTESTRIITDYLYANQSLKRMKDIMNYKLLINDNIHLGTPLYIKGDCINMLGGTTPSDALFQVDGARRLMANLLNKKPNMYIWLITPK